MQDQDTNTPKKRKHGGQSVPLHPNPIFASHGFTVSFPDRFWSKVNRTDTCWNWTGCMNGGYGSVWAGNGNVILANRAAWILSNGAIPEGMDVLHSCDNPRCVNPGHLFLGTHSENMTDMVSKKRQHRKFTEQQVISLRSDHSAGMSINQLRDKYSISRSNISAIINRITWNHI